MSHVHSIHIDKRRVGRGVGGVQSTVEAESFRRREWISVRSRMTKVVVSPEIGVSLITPSWVKTRRRRDSTEANAFSSPREVVSSVRESYAFIAHVRFDERDVETEHGSILGR